MYKSKFIRSTIILMIGGLITKTLGMLIKIVMTRLIGTEGIGIYMLMNPTFMLLIALAQLGFPIAISTLVAKERNDHKNLVFSILPISLILNLIILIGLFFGASYLSTELLHEPRCFYGIIAIGFVLPFISISSILRGYFFGKQRMVPHVVSNITEDIVRLMTLAIGIPIFLVKGIEYAVAFIILSNIASELTSILVLFFFLPKNFTISKQDFKPKKKNIKEILSISLPATGSRLIGNIGSFFEPILLTYVLLKIGYSNSFIVNQYGILNGYVLPLLLLPSFFSMAISQALIPVVSRNYEKKRYTYTKTKIRQAIGFSLLIGIPITILFCLFPEIFLHLIYHTNQGIDYLRVLAPIFILHYIQAPLTSTLQATGKAKTAMMGTLQGMILRTIILFGASYLNIGMWGLVIAMASNVIYVTFHQYVSVRKMFHNA